MRLNTRAFAISAGALTSVTVLLLTLLALVHSGGADPPLLLRSVLFGYSVSPPGAVIGAMWAYAYGFLFGAAFAFVYNLTSAPSEPPGFE